MLIHMHEPHSSGVRIITHFDRIEVVMLQCLRIRLLDPDDTLQGHQTGSWSGLGHLTIAGH